MRGVSAHQGEIKIIEVADPVPKVNELLVRVEAAGINGGDWHRDRVTDPNLPPALLPAHEMAGTVVAAGADTSRFTVGDRVMGVVSHGQAELAVIADTVAMPVPESLSMVEAGGFSEVFCVADDSLFTQCQLGPGDRLLVTGAGGGIGTAAVQLAHAVGATAVASARDKSKHPALESLGAMAALPDEAHAHGPFDVVLELVGGEELPQHLGSLASGGRVSLIGVRQAARVELAMSVFKSGRGSIHWSGLRRLSTEEKALVARRVEHRLFPLLESGRIRVPVDSVYPLEEAVAAWDYFLGGGKLGKVVLTIA